MDYCRLCGLWFPRKAALGVHMFKVHHRRAAYRRGATGTICRACDKNFWADNRLAIYLRSSRKCVLALRRWGVETDQLQAGIGSKRWKQRDVEQYTLSLPVQVQPGLPDVEEERWDPLMLEAHAALCDVLLAKDLPSDFVQIQKLIFDAVNQFPLYDDEAVTIFDYLLGEIQEVTSDCLAEFWSLAQFDHIVSALEGFRASPSPPPPEPAAADGHLTFKHF